MLLPPTGRYRSPSPWGDGWESLALPYGGGARDRPKTRGGEAPSGPGLELSKGVGNRGSQTPLLETLAELEVLSGPPKEDLVARLGYGRSCAGARSREHEGPTFNQHSRRVSAPRLNCSWRPQPYISLARGPKGAHSTFRPQVRGSFLQNCLRQIHLAKVAGFLKNLLTGRPLKKRFFPPF
jgi:hypothetical protein